MTQAAQSSPLLRRLGEMMEAGRLAGARALLAAVKAQAEPSVELVDLEARLLLREGQDESAIALLSDAMAAFPPDAGLLARRAEARIRHNTPREAVLDAADAVMLAPDCSWTKALLGYALLDLGRPEDAAPCLAEALRAEPANAGYCRALATACERTGQPDRAAEVLAAGIAATPGDVTLRTAAIMVEMRRRDFERAVALAEAARQAGIVDACVLGLLGHAWSSLGEHARATQAYHDALKLAPEDPYVRHLVAASGLLPEAERAPSEYVETVFDGYAERFEMHLLRLGYRIPGLVRAALLAARPQFAAAGVASVLDLGCGTGLIGIALSDLRIGDFTGVDLSTRMLREAGRKRIYTRLVQSDLETFLTTDTRPWQVIVAADVFCYFGALDPVLAAARERLTADGALIFSIETLEDDAGGPAWLLGRQGRYAHRLAAVHAAVQAAGLEVEQSTPATLRDEGDTPVAGQILLVRRRLDA